MLSFSRLGQVGRLGNQLFQVAFITHFAEKYGVTYDLPYWKYAEYFDYKFNFHQDIDRKYDVIIREPELGYHEDYFVNYLPDMHQKNVDIITGYFQSHKYFSKQHVLKIFKPNKKFTSIKIDPQQSIAISLRRGDFVKHRLYNNIEAEQFRRLLRGFKNQKVFVFTDDYQYCKSEFVGPQYEFMEGLSDIEQLLTMSKFTSFILSNSTFSYWGPMLNANPIKVLYPFYMFPDMDRCQMYNKLYWPQERDIYIPYKNEVNKAFNFGRQT